MLQLNALHNYTFYTYQQPASTSSSHLIHNDTLRDLVTLTLDLLTLNSCHMAGHVTNHATKFETSTIMHS